MPKVVLYPFFSQQDKVQGKFRLESDAGVKLYNYIAEKFRDLGWDVSVVRPPHQQCTDTCPVPGVWSIISPPLELDNMRRRIQWDPRWLLEVSDGCDMLLTQHEFLAYPLRCLRPGLRIVTECGIRPDTAYPETAALFPLSYGASDLVHCNSAELAKYAGDYCSRVSVWPFGVRDELFEPHAVTKTVDIVFPARASSTGYSGHGQFVAAFRGSAYKVLMTDPTRYLERSGEAPNDWLRSPLSTEDYANALRSSRVVVGLTTNGYGGYAFQEAIACGCVPVCLRLPEYEAIVGKDWPFFTDGTEHDLPDTVDVALMYKWTPYVKQFMRDRLGSYSAAWEVAKCDLLTLL